MLQNPSDKIIKILYNEYENTISFTSAKQTVRQNVQDTMDNKMPMVALEIDLRPWHFE